jgi:polysaccharide export outer membrane protein
VNLPLVGMMQAGGKTARQLAADVAAQLSKSYLQSPQVSVMVVEANSQKITVEGSVNQPGVFPVTGPTTLLQAIAMARGPDKTADLRKVAIFRTVEGRRAVAVFDLNAIRTGNAPDPAVYGSDIVIVEGSSAKGVWQSVIQAVPLIGVFRFF